MTEDHDNEVNGETDLPDEGKTPKVIRGALQAIGGVVPFAGGLFSAAAGAWSEHEQGKVNDFLKNWMKMIHDEVIEKEKTILEITSRIDIHDEEISNRIKSDEYQSLLKKAFRDWGCAESEEKRIYVRNILSNAATSEITSIDVVRLFIEWISTYSELHFAVIAQIYNKDGITRGEIWRDLGKDEVREDSPESDLYKLLFRDLSTGGIVRQHRETDYAGHFIKKPTSRRARGGGSQEMKSAFDDEDPYELTALGQQFVHYAMTDLPVKIEYSPSEDD